MDSFSEPYPGATATLNGAQSSPQRRAKPQSHLHSIYGPMIADGVRDYCDLLAEQEQAAHGAEKRRIGHALYLMRLHLAELDDYHQGQ